ERYYKSEILAAAQALQPETHTVELSVAAQKKTPEPVRKISQVLDDTLPASVHAKPQAPRFEEHRPSHHNRLDTFVVGNNRLPFAACQTIVDAPASVYNPLVIHGDHGLGKSHLLQAVAHQLHERRPGQRVRFVSCEEFANTYLRALQDRKLDTFRADYRSCQALIVDDVQFLSGKEKTQEEFLHTFDVLRNQGRQIVLSSIAHPRDIKDLVPRLAERFVSGLVARLTPPDFTSRVDMLLSKAQSRRLNISREIAEVLAARVERSVRELEGAVCKLAALAAAELRAPDREMALLALRELGYLREGPLSLEEVLEAVLQRTNQDADEIRSSKRHASLVRTRHIAMYLAKHLTTHSLSEIGRYFGNRDHSTVLHAERKVSNDAKQDENLRLELQALRRILGR
ncbi:MAG: chromosomal replication initiator protein DnaA, partial [Planctomycetes bacterium]|nr:chromosomal replication initiator protein DnaA [Planctomycetota bacterium]